MSDRLADLRREFDESFAVPARVKAREGESYLAVRIGGDAYAIRVADIGSVVAAPRICKLPSRHAALLGLAGHRGRIIAAYDSRILLGYPARSDLRWLVVVGSIALAVEGLEGYVQAPPQKVITADGTARTVLDVASLVRKIKEG